jgi:hypothetical protein
VRNCYESVGVEGSPVEINASASGCQQVFHGALNSIREYEICYVYDEYIRKLCTKYCFKPAFSKYFDGVKM